MKSSRKSVLVIGQQSSQLDELSSLLGQSRYYVAIADSEDQAVAHISQANPCLIILAGTHQSWSHALVRDLRSTPPTSGVTIVALTDCHAPSWLHQEDNPGFDGFLVNPISDEILTSLVQSASVRQAFLTAS
ncbi:hypothetical protein BST81_22790 [Leptolyngbya sp. 'hensonii']|uniref:response regulator n=1 Tax=Leptolyngbya sp. 'hensonii' TaxID=1922337 RepID=UPI00094FC42B|nr:hypothetical protein [Leptolyngbya sp. 'hensonii']OLP16059.1 hypothetical protein BST81_22790 [Leptolyngbya sp. 'hensonii']